MPRQGVSLESNIDAKKANAVRECDDLGDQFETAARRTVVAIESLPLVFGRPPDVIAEQPIHRVPLDVASVSTLIPLELLDSSPDQPRHELPDVEALARNIADVGLLQPICTRREGGRYTILAGHRRVGAYRWLQEHDPQPEWASIPAIVLRVNDDLSRLAQISAQIHVEPWSIVEEAQVIDQLRRAGLAQVDIAQMLNKTQGWVSKRLAILRDPVLAEQMLSGHVVPAVAEELLTVREPGRRHEMATRAAAERWSQSEARQHARREEGGRLARDIGRRARVLSKDLRFIDPAALTNDVLSDLVMLAKTIETRFPREREVSAA